MRPIRAESLVRHSALPPLADASCGLSARRGRRYPAGAHTGAVSASHRLLCDARIAVAPQNSLHSLRSLCSNNRGESEVEARGVRAPTAMLRFSPPHKSPPPGTSRRAALLVVFDEVLGATGKAVGGRAPAATYAAPRSAGLVAARASAQRVLTRRDCSSTTNEVSGASFATGTRPSTGGNPVVEAGLPHSSAGAYPLSALQRPEASKSQGDAR
jgi:hypothetical protein